jgi:hypothetical protein
MSDGKSSMTDTDREYSREEMREACRNNYNAGRADAVASTKADLNRSTREDALVAEIERLRAELAAANTRIIYLETELCT